MHVAFDILRNFTAIIMLVLGFRFMAWAGLCGRANGYCFCPITPHPT